MAATPEERMRNMDALVANGLRAQLRTGNILTGQYYLAIDFIPTAKKARIDWGADPPVWPSEPGALDDMQAKVAAILDKLDKIPYDQIGADLRKSLASLDTALKGADQLVRRADAELIAEVKTTLQAARTALDGAQLALEGTHRLTAPDAPLQMDAREALRELARAAEAIRALADQLERHPESLLRGKAEEKQP
ncbi:MAG: hypothetical protein EHM59_13735 [Betaproteobacteria bacterium]|nr:MAG: hypothetical protein EHM59_13735 [Betaproteobacteria bacterium]